VCADKPLGLLVEREAQLVLQANGTQEPKRIILEDRVRHGPETARLQIREPSQRVDPLPSRDRRGDGIDGEVTRPQVVLDPPAERREVDGAPVRESHAPGSMPLGEREEGRLGQARIDARGHLGVKRGDVDVHHRAAEELVPDSTAHHVGLDACHRGADALIHRRLSGRPGADPSGSPS
jgi:hypothetical protein